MKKQKTILLSLLFIDLLLLVIFPLIISNTFSNRTVPNNYSYSVNNILSITLNNRLKGSLKAQLLVFNYTSKEWELNYELIETIKNDMKKVTDTIECINESYLFSMNTSSLPGTIYFLLVTTIKNAKCVANKYLSTIRSDTTTWWYVDTVSVPTLNLSRIAAGSKTFKYNALNILELETGHIIFCQDGNFSYIWRERNDIIASPWLFNETKWISNEDFRQIVLNDFRELETRIPEITSLQANFLPSSPDLIIEPNFLINFFIHINYTKNLNYKNQLRTYFLLISILEKFWFTEKLNFVKTK